MMHLHEDTVSGFDLLGACVFQDPQSFVMRFHALAEVGLGEENKAKRILL